jgi:hypothetical protein
MPTIHDHCYTGAGYTAFFTLLDTAGEGKTGEKANITPTFKAVGSGDMATPDGTIDEVIGDQGAKGLYFLSFTQTETGSADGLLVACFEHGSYEDTWLFLRVIDEMPANAITVAADQLTAVGLSAAAMDAQDTREYMGVPRWKIWAALSSLFFWRTGGADTVTPQFYDQDGAVVITLQAVDTKGNRSTATVETLAAKHWPGS